jgi:transposase
MTPAEEAEFIALWQQGASQQELAAHLGVPVGTIKSRASALAHQGKIQPRPRGGGYPRQRRQAAPAPVQRPVQTQDTGAVQRLDTGAVQRLDRLEDEVQSLRHIVQALVDRLDHPPVQTPVQITTLRPFPKGKAVRWNLWILDAIKDQISALAAARDCSPSELVQEYLWNALND